MAIQVEFKQQGAIPLNRRVRQHELFFQNYYYQTYFYRLTFAEIHSAINEGP